MQWRMSISAGFMWPWILWTFLEWRRWWQRRLLYDLIDSLAIIRSQLTALVWASALKWMCGKQLAHIYVQDPPLMHAVWILSGTSAVKKQVINQFTPVCHRVLKSLWCWYMYYNIELLSIILCPTWSIARLLSIRAPCKMPATVIILHASHIARTFVSTSFGGHGDKW